VKKGVKGRKGEEGVRRRKGMESEKKGRVVRIDSVFHD
jgi:hypothetical protein